MMPNIFDIRIRLELENEYQATVESQQIMLKEGLESKERDTEGATTLSKYFWKKVDVEKVPKEILGKRCSQFQPSHRTW